MKTSRKADDLLNAMGRIKEMERGKLCQMKGREHFNHQEWLDGRNVVRYIPKEDVTRVQQAINEYAKFMDLVRQYVDEIVRITREERKKTVLLPQSGSSAKVNKLKSRN